jgi:lantibiotic transport system permease protein
MKFILRNLQTEFIKAQQTLVYWLMVICPLILVGLVFLIYNADNADFTKEMAKSKENPWLKFYQIHYQMLVILFLPLYVAMFNNLLYTKEHQYKMWKHLYSLPVPKWSVFVAKSLFSLLLLFATFLIFAILLTGSGYLLSAIYPKFTFNNHNPLIINHLGLLLRLFVASLAMWAIHNWLSLRFGSFALSIGMAILSVVLTPIVLQSGERLGNWIYVYPYTYALASIKDITKSALIWNFTDKPILLGFGVALVVSILGYWEYRRKAISA